MPAADLFVRFLRAIAIVAGLLAAATVAAQDLERERRLEAQIADAILDGEGIHLDAQGTEFFGIFMESEVDEPLGGAIIMHGRGFHPDWSEVAGPLRVTLPEHGWHTLSLQMPVLEKGAKYFDYVPVFPAAFPRIDAGIAYLRARGIERIVLIAHSCSVHMTMAYVRERGDSGFDAYVGIGMGATDYQQRMRAPFPLAAMRVPVLDLYGTAEYPAVLRGAPGRRAAIEAAGNPLSRQQAVPDADHYFRGGDAALIEAVAAWLETVAPR